MALQLLALLIVQGALAGGDPLGLEVVHRDPVLEEGREQRRVQRVAEVVRAPRLILGHAQDAVADVAILADDVRVRVVHVVVRVAPLVGRAGGVPLKRLAVQALIARPVVLPVHDVVADLHVVEDLRQRQRGGAADPCGRQEAGEQQAAAGDLEAALDADEAVDVVDVALTEVCDDAGADRVELLAEGLELLGCEIGCWGGHGLLLLGVGVLEVERDVADRHGHADADLLLPGARESRRR